MAKQLRLYEGIQKKTYDGNVVLVLVGNVTRVSVGAINYAQSIGDEVLAMHISTKETEEKDQEILQEFADYFPNITLKTLIPAIAILSHLQFDMFEKSLKKPRTRTTRLQF